MSENKQIELTTKEAKDLSDLMFRGLAYTDAYYRSSKRMKIIYLKVMMQIDPRNKSVYQKELDCRLSHK